MKHKKYIFGLAFLFLVSSISKISAQNLCTEVRVLVVYSNKLANYYKDSKGGTDKLLDKIDDLEGEVNTSFGNSGINHRIRVVGKIRISDWEAYEDPPNLADTDIIKIAMERCSASNSETSKKRDMTRADLVIVIKRNSGKKTSGGNARGQAQGVSYIDPNKPWKNNIYSIAVMDDGAFSGDPKYTFTHELGHLYGAQHDKQMLDDQRNAGLVDDLVNYFFPGANATQYGYVRNNSTNPFRTIMSYKKYCSHCAWSDVVQHFSNPNKTVRLGGTNYSTGTTSANNAGGINDAYPYIRSLKSTTDYVTWDGENVYNYEFINLIAKKGVFLQNTIVYELGNFYLQAPVVKTLPGRNVRIKSKAGRVTRIVFRDPCNGGGSDLLPLYSSTDVEEYDKYINGTTLQVNVNPNPHRNNFTLDFETRVPGNVGYKIFDQTGKEVFSKSFGELEYGRYEETVNTQLFPKGFYILKMRLGSEYITTVKLTKF